MVAITYGMIQQKHGNTFHKTVYFMYASLSLLLQYEILELFFLFFDLWDFAQGYKNQNQTDNRYDRADHNEY